MTSQVISSNVELGGTKIDFTYIIILTAVLIISPFILRLAASQKKEVKQRLKSVYIFILSAQIILGFLNWENFSVGRSGYELSLTHPHSLLGLFFLISMVQIFLLLLNNYFQTSVVVLNFTNTIVIFTAMIRLSNILGNQIVSYASIIDVLLVLIGNVVSLMYINKDQRILSKLP